MALTINDYLKIKKGIESTPSESGRTISEIEFNWFYSKDGELKLAEREVGDNNELLMIMQLFAGTVSVFKIPKDLSNMVASIHNHHGYVLPSPEDVSTLLKITQDSNPLYSIIASTVKGKVRGFYEMRFMGNDKERERLKAIPLETYYNACNERQKDIEKNPQRYVHLHIGENTLRLEEIKNMMAGILERCLISTKVVPMRGFHFKDWEFFRDFQTNSE